MYEVVKLMIFLVLGVTAVFLARHLLWATIGGAIGYLALRAVVPEGSSKLESLKHLLGLLKVVFLSAKRFGEMFIVDLRIYSIAALLIGIALGILILAGRRKWSCS